MANEEQLKLLRQGVRDWNNWRDENPDEAIDLTEAHFRETTSFKGANFSEADLSGSWLMGADFVGARLDGANLSRAFLEGAFMRNVNLSGANLRETRMTAVDLVLANLTGADLTGAILNGANLSGADLTDAILTEVELVAASLVRTEVHRAKISGSYIYGINVWDLKGEFAEQEELVITPPETPIITVDNMEVAQFIYLLVDNQKIRTIIDTVTSKAVLILGRFSIPQRKAVLDALRNKLREYDLLPIVFDFERPTDKDFTETIKTLAGLCYFVIADVTNPKSSPLELQATVPDYQIPFVPIIQEGEQPFAMMVDLQKKYNWVLDTLSYTSIDALIKALKPAIIDPAIQKHNELRLIKAQEPKIRSANDFIDDKRLK